MQSFPEPLFNVTHFANAGLLWIQVKAKGKNGYSNTIHIEINFKKDDEDEPIITGQEMTISMLPILCLLAGSLAVLLSIVAGILECSRRKYNVSNEVTHISFSNNLDLNPSKLLIWAITLISLINVGLRLFFLRKYSRPYAVIPDPTFIFF